MRKWTVTIAVVRESMEFYLNVNVPTRNIFAKYPCEELCIKGGSPLAESESGRKFPPPKFVSSSCSCRRDTRCNEEHEMRGKTFFPFRDIDKRVCVGAVAVTCREYDRRSCIGMTCGLRDTRRLGSHLRSRGSQVRQTDERIQHPPTERQLSAGKYWTKICAGSNLTECIINRTSNSELGILHGTWKQLPAWELSALQFLTLQRLPR